MFDSSSTESDLSEKVKLNKRNSIKKMTESDIQMVCGD